MPASRAAVPRAASAPAMVAGTSMPPNRARASSTPGSPVTFVTRTPAGADARPGASLRSIALPPDIRVDFGLDPLLAELGADLLLLDHGLGVETDPLLRHHLGAGDRLLLHEGDLVHALAD